MRKPANTHTFLYGDIILHLIRVEANCRGIRISHVHDTIALECEFFKLLMINYVG